jgi:radical SAM superfamily enzyme YgiQ (UPF0313 family)
MRSNIPSRKELLSAEQGAITKDAPHRVALVYPSPYRVAMSSLGYQTIYRELNGRADVAADRATLDHQSTFERNQPLSTYRILAFSVAYELELEGLFECIEAAGVPVLREQRSDSDAIIVAGGPLTFSNPAPLSPFVDIIVLGEGEELIHTVVDACIENDYRRGATIEALRGVHGLYLPHLHGDTVPAIAQADNSKLPARSQIITPHTELSSMYLTEAARGCSRGCTYCVMRRSTNGGMRMVDPDLLISGIPGNAKRVGLVGAAVTDHPRIAEIVRKVVAGDRQVGISSLRADKLTDELVGLLAKGGYRTLTIAADGASERMRRVIERSTQEKHLIESARLAKKHKLSTVKIYMMLGHPEERDEDIDELIRFIHELTAVHPRIALGIAPFVAKRHTPLDGTPYAGIATINARLTRLRRGLKGRAEMRPTSARWAWVEYMLAQGDSNAGLAALAAVRSGGRFADYKRAFTEGQVQPTGPVARVPSSSELITLHRNRRRDRDAAKTSLQ